MALPWVLLICVLVFIAGRMFGLRKRARWWDDGSYLAASLQGLREMVSADVQALIDRGDAALAKLPAAVATATTAAVTAAINSRDSDRSDDMSAFGGFVGRVESGVNGVSGSSASPAPADSNTNLSADDTAAYAAAQTNGFNGSADAWLAAGKPTGAVAPTGDDA